MSLSDIRVLDLSRVLAGPFCSMLLADLGAEVIKVESPGTGDDTRSWGPPFAGGESAYFLSINRNKKSITLNLKKKKGQQILHDLAKTCDVLLENFSPGVTQRLAVDYETICTVNPKLIYCSISGFGQYGPYKEQPAYDIVIQGMSGLMSITGEKDRPPVRIGVAITDIGAGMYACIAILASLMARKRTGRGQCIDISLLDGAVSWMTYMAGNYFVTDRIPNRMGSAHPNIVPYQCFECREGRYLTLAVGNDKIWKIFCSSIGLEEISRDSRFSTNPRRVENRTELISILVKVFLKRERDSWIRLLSRVGVPCGPVYNIGEIFQDSHIQCRKMSVEIDHPKAGKIRQIGIPIKKSYPEAEKKMVAPPLLGQHNEEILKDLLGYSSHKIKQLEQEGVL